MSVPTAQGFLKIVSSVRETDSEVVSFVFGSIDSSYSSGNPKILFDGETVVSVKAYPFLSSYDPVADDKVILAKISGSYVVLGKFDGSVPTVGMGSVIAVANGGTGATTSVTACDNLSTLYMSGNGNTLASFTDYATLPAGHFNVVYTTLKTNDPFTSAGAKRVDIFVSYVTSNCKVIRVYCVDGVQIGNSFLGFWGGVTLQWYNIWTSNSDGTGSGLDADLLDGTHLSVLCGLGTALPATSGTMTATMDGSIKKITPTGSCTFNASGGTQGQECSFTILTSGTTSYTLTWGTNFTSQGTLATGTVTGKKINVTFKYDGTTWNEIARTAAM